MTPARSSEHKPTILSMPLDVAALFPHEDPYFVTIVAAFVPWVQTYGFALEVSKTRMGRPGFSLRFLIPGDKHVFGSFQFHDNRFLQFAWSKRKLRELGIEDQMKALLLVELRALTSATGPSLITIDAYRLYLGPGDLRVVDTIKSKIDAILKPAWEKRK